MKHNSLSHLFASALISCAIVAPAYAATVQNAEGTGTVQSINRQAATITLTHDPIPALKWPGMTMPFNLQNPALSEGLAVGQKVKFTLINSDKGYQINAISVIKK